METVPVAMGDRAYNIMIEADSLPRTGAFVRSCAGPGARAACVVTSETVAGLYLDTVAESLSEAAFAVTTVVIPDGEEAKTLATYEAVITRLIRDRFERTGVIVPLGGGVVGDLAGFVAATYLRGIPFVQVPTTIVAQVDSSIGGKVAVNHPLGKNLIGAFHQPLGVWIDTRVLATLPHREVVSGMGEAIKHGVIRDRDFFAFLEEHLDAVMNFSAPDAVMEKFIAWNCRIKAAVVAADEREQGLRAILNYGHTVGHALEAVTGYARFTHGEAVMLGMLAAGRIAVSRGFMPEDEFGRQNRLLFRTGINGSVEGLDPAALYDAMTRDKKVAGGKIRFVLPDSIGAVRIHADITRAGIEDGIASMLAAARGG